MQWRMGARRAGWRRGGMCCDGVAGRERGRVAPRPETSARLVQPLNPSGRRRDARLGVRPWSGSIARRRTRLSGFARRCMPFGRNHRRQAVVVRRVEVRGVRSRWYGDANPTLASLGGRLAAICPRTAAGIGSRKGRRSSITAPFADAGLAPWPSFGGGWRPILPGTSGTTSVLVEDPCSGAKGAFASTLA